MFRTLIVEDNMILRQSLKKILCVRFPYMVVDEASDAGEALQKVDTLHPDFILMDIKLPRESGLVLTKKIKTDSPETIISILTNYDLPEYRKAAYEYGANYFLSKSSSTTDDILTLIESTLSEQGFDPDGRKSEGNS